MTAEVNSPDSNQPDRSSLERRTGDDRRVAGGEPPGGKERRRRNRRNSLADRRGENNVHLATFYLGEEFFGVQVERVQEIIRPQDLTPVPIADKVIRGLINLRGQIVTAIDLRRAISMPDSEHLNEQMNLIVNFSDGADSLLVDRIGDVLEVSANRIEPPPLSMEAVDSKFIEGVCKLDQGLLLILDVDRVTGRVESSS